MCIDCGGLSIPTGPQGPKGDPGVDGTDATNIYSNFISVENISMAAGFTTLYHTVTVDGTYVLQLQGSMDMLVAGTLSSRLMLGATYQSTNDNCLQVTSCDAAQQFTFTHTAKIVATPGAPTIGFMLECDDLTALINNVSLLVFKIA